MPLFVVHALQRRRRIGFRQFIQQRPRTTHSAFHLPESIAAMKLRVLSTWYRVPSNVFVIPTPERKRGAEESRYQVLGTSY